MSTSSSERRLRVVALACVAAMAAAALVFHLLQNRLALTGGGIAWPKSLWLGCALLYWFVLPALLLRDTRLLPAWRLPFAALLALMGLRGVIELWMLYVSHNWSPFYGIAHDGLCLAALWGLALRARAVFGTHRLALVHALATGLLFIPEIYFAWYMQAHFQTQGEKPLYFVPDDEAHAHVLALTTAADAAALLYLPAFLYAWLHGKTEVTGARAQRTG
ncbi:hypothetical protein ACS5PN_07250 [Roseateles sp. NT4]|uniref:hypothetical protein n=1 Tax=Roseateles sp. NT4 TaxID=3453715 RepID=UPI003EEAD975